MSSDDDEPSTFKRYLVKPATIGAVGAGMTKYMYPNAQLTMSMGGQQVPLWMASGGAIMASSLGAEIFHDYVFPHIFHDKKLSEPISLAVAGSVTGGANVGVNRLYNAGTLTELGVGNLFMYGALAEAIGTLAYEKGISHWIG